MRERARVSGSVHAGINDLGALDVDAVVGHHAQPTVDVHKSSGVHEWARLALHRWDVLLRSVCAYL